MERKSMTFAIRIDQLNSGICIHPIPGALMTAMVVRKLIPVNVEEATSKI